MKIQLMTIVALTMLTAMAASDAVTIGTVCDEKYCGWPTVAKRANGEILVVFSGNREGHVCPYGKVQICRSSDNGKTWSAPVNIQESPFVDSRDAGIVELKDGTLLLNWFTSIAYRKNKQFQAFFEKQKKSDILADLGYWTARSTDGGKTWEKKVRCNGSCPHNAIQLKSGRLMMLGRIYPSQDFHPDDVTNHTHKIIAEVSDDDGRSWRKLATLPTAEDIKSNELHEPYVVELKNGTLLGLIRYHGKVGGGSGTCQTESHDGGKTWTPIRRVPINGFPAHAIILKDGRILVSYAKRDGGVEGEYAIFSSDNGKTWVDDRMIAPWVGWDIGYPSSVQLDDGRVMTVFYQANYPNHKPTIKYAIWDPAYKPRYNAYKE